MLSGIPDGSLPDTLAAIVKASYLEKLEVSYQHTFIWILCQKRLRYLMTKRFYYMKDFCIFCTATKRLGKLCRKSIIKSSWVKEIGDSCCKHNTRVDAPGRCGGHTVLFKLPCSSILWTTYNNLQMKILHSCTYLFFLWMQDSDVVFRLPIYKVMPCVCWLLQILNTVDLIERFKKSLNLLKRQKEVLVTNNIVDEWYKTMKPL